MTARFAPFKGDDRTVTKSYIDLRSATEMRDRSLRDKVMSLGEAAALIADRDHVALGGCTLSRTPMAMVWALIRAGKKELSISRSITSTEGDLLYGSGASRHILTSWFSQGIVWGVSKVMRHYTENKLARFEEWSHMAIGLRYRAGAMGGTSEDRRGGGGGRSEEVHRAGEAPLHAAGEVVPARLRARVVSQVAGFGGSQVGGEPEGVPVAFAQGQGAQARALLADAGQLHKAVGRGGAQAIKPWGP